MFCLQVCISTMWCLVPAESRIGLDLELGMVVSYHVSARNQTGFTLYLSNHLIGIGAVLATVLIATVEYLTKAT